MSEAETPKELDWGDADLPGWISDWADDVCDKAPYPDHGYAPTQRVMGYVRWLEARVFVPECEWPCNHDEYTDWLNDLMVNAGDEWDGDEAMESLVTKYVHGTEAALAESRGVATRFRDAVSDIFAKANDDHWSNAAAVKWISTRCLVALEAPHEST